MSTMRLTGLSSGMDTDTIISNLMKIQQLKVDRLDRKQTLLEWKQTALTDIKSELNSFKNTYLSTLGSSSMRLSATYNAYKVTTSGTNASAVTISAGSSNSAKSLSITSVKQATAAKAVSTDKVSSSGTLASSNSTALKDLDFAQDLDFAEVTTTDEDGNESTKNVISFAINDTVFEFDENTTLSSMMSTINNAGIGVTMSYSRLTDKISFSTTDTGEGKDITITNIAGNAFGTDAGNPGAFGINADYTANLSDITEDENGVKTLATQTATIFNGTDAARSGSDAVVTGIVDGVAFEYTNASNGFTVDGLTFTLNRDMSLGEEAINATIDRDYDATVDSIKSFIESYNTIISKLESLLKEKKTSSESSYTPLTDEEKEDMTDAQIEKWEAIAKKGVLYGDSGLQSLVSGLSKALYQSVEAAGLSPSQIGLSTGGYFDGTGGQIILDEEKLRAALQENPEKVQSVFTNSSNTYSEKGLVNKMESLITTYVNKNQSTSLSSIEKSLTDISDKISKLETKMTAQMEKYYLKFAAMETAMSNLSSQSSWLASMFGG